MRREGDGLESLRELGGGTVDAPGGRNEGGGMRLGANRLERGLKGERCVLTRSARAISAGKLCC